MGILVADKTFAGVLASRGRCYTCVNHTLCIRQPCSCDGDTQPSPALTDRGIPISLHDVIDFICFSKLLSSRRS